MEKGSETFALFIRDLKVNSETIIAVSDVPKYLMRQGGSEKLHSENCRL